MSTERGWVLQAPTVADFDELMTWFPDAHSVDIWGGPRMRFPFTRSGLLEDCQLDKAVAYCLRDPEGRMAAFGQVYERLGRAHLARLVSNPSMRRQGVGRRLITMLIDTSAQTGGYTEASLFVYRDNAPAYQCYLALGFTVQAYPDDAKMKEKCYFLTRSCDLETPGRGKQ